MKKIILITAIILAHIVSVVGQDCVVCDQVPTGTGASIIGKYSTADGAGSVAIGSNTHTLSTALNSIAIGTMVKTIAGKSIVIGCGTSSQYMLTNNIQESLIIGFNSNKPTLFVSRSGGYNKTGKVGIGNVTNPQHKLHIKADAGEQASVLIAPDTWNIGAQASLLLGNNYYGVKVDERIGLIFKTQKDYYFSEGRVSLNTSSSPTASDMFLTVKGNQIIYGPNASLFFGDDLNTISGYGKYGIEYQNGGLNFWIPWEGKEGRFMNYVLFLNDDGNVGINDPEPAAKLSVNGTVLFYNDDNQYLSVGENKLVFGSRKFNITAAFNGNILANEIEVSTDSWSDYVFEEDYLLIPIEEVEDFIKENKHLPGVPSENEVIEEGINLGEMDAILLKKIEELTLYVIKLKKELDKVQQQNPQTK
jgi:hypothetical protein